METKHHEEIKHNEEAKHPADTRHHEHEAGHHPPPKKGFPKLLIAILIILVIGGAAGGIWYFIEEQKYVYSEDAAVNVPMIQLTPKTAGILKEVFVSEGQNVTAHQSVARVGDDIISAEIPGIVATAKQDIGAFYSASQAVVTMYDPAEMRIVASIEENKGLNEIKVLDKVKFTVDAFGSREFEGFVEEISPSSHSGDVVFSISDKRQIQKFDVKIRYDIRQYPNFKNGMSARVWIYK
jgi:multidrug resistance efflux pump